MGLPWIRLKQAGGSEDREGGEGGHAGTKVINLWLVSPTSVHLLGQGVLFISSVVEIKVPQMPNTIMRPCMTNTIIWDLSWY